MPTHIVGKYYSDLAVGEKEDVTDEMMDMIPSQTPFLNSTGFPGNGKPKNNTLHKYYDDAYVPLRTTLTTTLTAAATTVVLPANIAKPGQEIEIEGETILLGVSADRTTFTGCTRSVGTPAAAAHTSGVPVLIVGKPEAEGDAFGSGDVSQEPREVSTYVRTFERTIEVAFEANEQERYGRPAKPYDDKAVKFMRDIKLEIEHASWFAKASAPAPSSGSAGNFDGFKERVVGTNTTAMGGADFTHSTFRTAVEAIADFHDPDLKVNTVLMCPINQTFVFDGWAQAHVVVSPSDPLAQTYGVNVKRLQFGPMTIDVIGVNRLYKDAFLYQPNYIKWRPYIPLTHERQADSGRQMRGIIHGSFVPEIYCPEAHYTFTGLNNS